MKNNYLPFKVHESPFDPWPDRHFVFAQISEIRYKWDEDSYYHHFGDFPIDSDHLFKIYKNVLVKLFQPHMKLSEAHDL